MPCEKIGLLYMLVGFTYSTVMAFSSSCTDHIGRLCRLLSASSAVFYYRIRILVGHNQSALDYARSSREWQMNDKSDKLIHVAENYLGKAEAALTPSERRILEKTVHRRSVARDPGADLERRATRGERLADAVAAFGGSWKFIGGFLAFLVVWTGANALAAADALDPYPFIFLNLMLSMLAALQAPVIMMSQNRQAAKDREASAHDYEVNLKAEIEIMALHEKLDQMRNAEMRELIAQQQQIDLLTSLVRGGKRSESN